MITFAVNGSRWARDSIYRPCWVCVVYAGLLLRRKLWDDKSCSSQTDCSYSWKNWWLPYLCNIVPSWAIRLHYLSKLARQAGELLAHLTIRYRWNPFSSRWCTSNAVSGCSSCTLESHFVAIRSYKWSCRCAKSALAYIFVDNKRDSAVPFVFACLVLYRKDI